MQNITSKADTKLLQTLSPSRISWKGKETSIDTDDEQLMLNYAGGNMQAFKLLYARYEQRVYRYVYNGCNNEAVSHELFQEVWLRVIKASGTFTTSQPFKPWLFRIASNLLIDNYRRQSRSALDQLSNNEVDTDPDTVQHDSLSTSEDAWTCVALTPEQTASASQRSETLRSALHCLPLAQREAVMLKHVAGFTINEIAQMQGQSVQAVKSRLRYAMVKLRLQLKELA